MSGRVSTGGPSSRRRSTVRAGSGCYVGLRLAAAGRRSDAADGLGPALLYSRRGQRRALFVGARRPAALLHQGRAKVASLEEMVLLGLVIGSSGMGRVPGQPRRAVGTARASPPAPPWPPWWITAWTRAAWRRAEEVGAERRTGDHATRALVIGAGDAGRELIASMLRDPDRSGSRWASSTTTHARGRTAGSGACRSSARPRELRGEAGRARCRAP